MLFEGGVLEALVCLEAFTKSDTSTEHTLTIETFIIHHKTIHQTNNLPGNS